jgi:mono/diheme cytochrome c family protein
LPDGDAKKGEQAFLDLKCHRCHRVEGFASPAPEQFNLLLGGETAQVKTYGQLVTSIINPSHVLSERYQRELNAGPGSPMPSYANEMTVGQMIDLVAFLQRRYRLMDTAFEPPLP